MRPGSAPRPGLLEIKPTLTGTILKHLEVGELALICDEWHLRGTGEDGNPVETSGVGTHLARRQPDGTWRWVMVNPRWNAIG
jgi:ketosteroid isomerase-like protein